METRKLAIENRDYWEKRMSVLVWEDTNDITLDSTIIFDKGFNFFGLEHLRQEAKGANGNYLIWHNPNRWWSLYRDSDGMLSLEAFETEQKCKNAADRWNEETNE